MAVVSDSSTSDDLGSLATVMAALARTSDVAALAPGSLVEGQYRIEQKLGAGGMGVVFLARDERLGRAVAIKLGNAVSSDGLRRIEREAQALAQLSHPNVVVVHQVGELGGRVFIVMEYVAGGTARTWLTAARRDWRAIVDLYLAAGDGLAAAHAAGLVHRDFKPDNVLVGSDGRPRVADFGLVQASGVTSSVTTSPATTGDLTDTPMTETGAVLGTPAYMAPEQIDAGEIDARADQFAFCASLWEALFGTRPFDGHTPAEVRNSIESSAPRRDPARRGVPRAVADALRRGLASKKEDRWRDMHALLAALRRTRDRRRRRALAGAGVVALAAVASTAFMLARRSAGDPCSDGARRIAAVWNADRTTRLTAKLHADDAPRVTAMLDDYARRWALGHRDACRATRVDRSQSDAMLDRRDVCLARVATMLDATLGEIERATPEQLLRVDEMLGQLPDVERCRAVDALGTEDPPPAAPEARKALLDAMRAVSEATTVVYQNADPAAPDIAARAVEQARATGWRPEIARALNNLGEARYLIDDHDNAVTAWREAADLAIASRSDGTAAIAFAGLARELSYLMREGEARLALQMAQSISDRVGAHDVSTVVATAGLHLELDLEHWDAAIAAGRKVIDLVADDTPAERGHARYRLALVYDVARRHDQTLEHADAAIALFEKAYGKDHPLVATALQLRASANLYAGNYDAAVADANRTLAIYERRLGPDSPPTWNLHNILGEIARQRGDAAGARSAWTRALAIVQKNPLELQGQSFLLTNLGILDLEAGNFAAGLARFDLALPIMEKLVGTEGAPLVDLLVARGYALRAMGQHDRARAEMERAARISERGYGPLHASTVNAQIELGLTLVAAGDAPAAMRLLAPLVGAVDADKSERPPHQPIELRLALASAHWAAGDRAAARRVAADAARTAGDTEPAHSLVLAWRAEHR